MNNMVIVGGLILLIALATFPICALFADRKVKKPPRSLRNLAIMRSASKIAHKNYLEIKNKLPNCKPLTRFAFRILVGKKRWENYTAL